MMIKTIIGLLLILVILSGCITPSTRLSKIDSDKDGLSDAEELALGSNPNNPDTDGDGINDAKDPDPLNLPTKSPLPTTTPAPTTTAPPTTTPAPTTTTPPTTTPAPTTTAPTTTTPPTTTPTPTTLPPEVEIYKDELIYTTNTGNVFYHATGTDGLTQPQTIQNVLPTSGNAIYTMAAGDFNGDGKDELIYTTNTGNVFYHATGTDGLTQPQTIQNVLPTSGNAIYTMAAGDFDGE